MISKLKARKNLNGHFGELLDESLDRIWSVGGGYIV